MTTATPPTGALSRHYTPERLELEYSPAKWHADRAETLHHHHVLGKRAVETSRPSLDIRYGDGPLQTLDLFPATVPVGPCCFIVHGGFWRISDKSAFHFIAAALSQQGMTCIVPNFDLCPAISIAQMVGEICDALTWTAENAPTFDGASSDVILFGHATGAHLAAMSLMESNNRSQRSWLSRVRGALLVSGLYDLRRIPELEVNDILGLDSKAAASLSPCLSRLSIKAPLVIASAAEETFEFQCQAADFAEALWQQEVPTELIKVQNVGHFNILDELSSAAGPCMEALIRLSGARRPQSMEVQR